MSRSDLDVVEDLSIALIAKLKSAKGIIKELKKTETAAQAEVLIMKEELQGQRMNLNDCLSSLTAVPLAIDKSGEVANLMNEATKLKATISSLQSKVLQQKRQLDFVLAENEVLRRAQTLH